MTPARPWDPPREDAGRQRRLAVHGVGRLAVDGPPGDPSRVRPLRFAHDAGRGEAVTRLARPDPLWRALEAGPDVPLGVVDDHAHAPGPRQAAPPEHGAPTGLYATVRFRCRAHLPRRR